ncbi:hypothetical protein LNP74_18440 [Klebsiella pneumoniae subsp. pneumoniae]|nr:hypothetical protein [Klebsiella pneumoniae subsp. pneumoniae]
MVSLVRNLEEFFARESCGWCTPCRDGLPWSVKILRALERGEGQPGDIETLEQLCRFLGPGKTFCAHAPGAVEPLQSAIKYFREEFEAGIKQQFSNTHAINGFSRTCLRRAGNLKVFYFWKHANGYDSCRRQRIRGQRGGQPARGLSLSWS